MAGLVRGPLSQAVLRPLLHRFAARFARLIADADARAGSDGLAAAADVILDAFTCGWECAGAPVVASGPLIVVANHPGTVDAPALWRLLAVRPDLLVIALDRPFLHAVPQLARSLLYVEDARGSRATLVRRSAEHLGNGGALLTFPAGTIEPDPVVRPRAALASLRSWSRSPELLTRLVPDAVVQPVAVACVMGRQSLTGPWTRGRTLEDAERAAATWQIVRREPVTPRLLVGEPLAGGTGLTGRLLEAMTTLLPATQHPDSTGTRTPRL